MWSKLSYFVMRCVVQSSARLVAVSSREWLKSSPDEYWGESYFLLRD